MNIKVEKYKIYTGNKGMKVEVQDTYSKRYKRWGGGAASASSTRLRADGDRNSTRNSQLATQMKTCYELACLASSFDLGLARSRLLNLDLCCVRAGGISNLLGHQAGVGH